MNNNFEQVEDDREDCQFIKSPPKTIEQADIPQEIATRDSSEHSYSEILSNEEIIKLFIQGEKKLVYNQKLLIEPQFSCDP